MNRRSEWSLYCSLSVRYVHVFVMLQLSLLVVARLPYKQRSSLPCILRYYINVTIGRLGVELSFRKALCTPLHPPELLSPF